MSRTTDLLKAAAGALEEGEDPFGGSFLREHDVESGECLDLADSLALGARLIAWAMENPRQAVTAARGAGDYMKMDAIIRVLRKLNGEGGRS